MKKLIAMFLAFALMVSCPVVISAEEIITIDDKIQYLISHGVPEDFLENKEDPDINELYDSLYGEMFEFTGTQTVEMSESVGFPGISTLGTIPESDMKLSITTFTYFDYDNSTKTKTKIKEVKV